MNKLSIISLVVALVGTAISCSDVRRDPGRIYMPDMTYSRAYETYSPHKNLEDSGINYTAMPVPGTIKRGELFPFAVAKDKEGDSSNYVASKAVTNPLAGGLDSAQLNEAGRLYLIHCGICHGTKLDGNGPLYKDGSGPYPAAPRNLTDAYTKAMPDGQIFYSITYGKNLMGPYGSQLSTTQRWMLVDYIRSQQNGASPLTAGATSAPGDSTGTQPTQAPATK